jgi:putative hydrolase of the HAD superfamily
MIRHILFDLGNVLAPLKWDLAFGRLIPHLPPDLADLCANDRPAFQNLLAESATALETGCIEFDEFYRIVSEILRTDLTEEEFHDIYCRIFTLDEEMVALGEILRERYGTWLVSNTSRVHYEYIVETFPRVEFYRGAALSFELGAMKPSVEYYEKAIQKFGIEPASSVFIDDLAENVAGAVAVGMTGIVFRNKVQLLDELKSLGVRVPENEELLH